MTDHDAPALPIPEHGLRGLRVVWRCGWCSRYMPLDELWGHMEAHHGIVRSADGRYLQQQPYAKEQAA